MKIYRIQLEQTESKAAYFSSVAYGYSSSVSRLTEFYQSKEGAEKRKAELEAAIISLADFDKRVSLAEIEVKP
jgi:hypothetical protein